MTAFAYSTGNINNLVGGSNASMADIQGPFVDLRSFINGGTMDETNVPNLAAAFTTWRTIAWGGGVASLTTVTGAATFVLWAAGSTVGNVNVQAIGGGGGSAAAAFLFDPADYSANARTTKLRLRVKCIVNAVAPVTTFVAGLYPVSTYGGASGTVPFVASVGTVITGSTAGFTTPGLGTNQNATSTEFTAPAISDYILGFTASNAIAANSQVQLTAQLQMRQV